MSLRRISDNYEEDYADYGDDVFVDETESDRFVPQRFRKYKEFPQRTDSQGFGHTRDQLRKVKYNNKRKMADQSKIFIYNVSKRYSVDDIYYHLIDSNIKIMDIWQSSHKDARKRSFVAVLQKIDANHVRTDSILANLGIRVKDYEERNHSSF